MKHVIIALKLPSALHRNKILRLLDNADNGGIPALVLAYAARVGVGNIAADGAVVQIPLDIDQCLGKINDVLFLHPKDMKCQSPSCFGSDSRQARERINQ